MDLSGKVAMVTGAGRGIGRSIALALGEHGADIFATDLALESVEPLARELVAKGRKCLPAKIDVACWDEIQAGVSLAIDRLGSIDVLVNNAGVVKTGLLLELDETAWDVVCDINLKGVWLCTKAVVPHMKCKGRGRIINLASIASKTGEFGNGVYCVTKAGVAMLTQCWALELAEYGINVNALCPGYIYTEMLQGVCQERGQLEGMTSEEYRQSMIAQIPLRRMGKPEEVGELAAFLASEAASYITGEAIVISGGKEMH